jgi:hypothetical protein
MKKRPTPSPYKRFASLSAAEKEAAYRECDDPDIALRGKPLDSRMKKLWNRAKRKAGRPRVGRGAARVLVSIERGLLEDADDFAKSRRISRSQLVSRGIKAVLALAG